VIIRWTKDVTEEYTPDLLPQAAKKPKKKKKNKQTNKQTNNKTETVLQEGDENAAKLPETYDSERLTAAAQDKKSPDKKSCQRTEISLDVSSSTIGE
jgi:hypothetical protein